MKRKDFSKSLEIKQLSKLKGLEGKVKQRSGLLSIAMQRGATDGFFLQLEYHLQQPALRSRREAAPCHLAILRSKLSLMLVYRADLDHVDAPPMPNPSRSLLKQGTEAQATATDSLVSNPCKEASSCRGVDPRCRRLGMARREALQMRMKTREDMSQRRERLVQLRWRRALTT